MEKFRSGAGREKAFPAGILFLCGFLAGTVVPNLVYRIRWKQMAAAAVYLLGTFCQSEVTGSDYLLQILSGRGSFLFLCLLGGITVFGVPLSVVTLLLSGFGLGALLAVSILQFGLAGGALGAALLFPQYLCYFPAILELMGAVFRQSRKLWKNQGLLSREIGTYMRECIWPLFLWAAGVLLEVWLNPWLLEKLLKLINFD